MKLLRRWQTRRADRQRRVEEIIAVEVETLGGIPVEKLTAREINYRFKASLGDE